MNSSGMNDSLALDDEDRLPWLEPAYDDNDDDSDVSPLRLALFILAGLVLLGLVVGGVYLLRSTLSPQEAPQVIAAPKDDYKIPAKDADAKKFQGEGDSSFAASEGLDRSGKIDPSRLPEAPITAKGGSAPTTAVDKSAAGASTQVSSHVTDKTGERATAASPAAIAKSGGPAIQLGAYASDAIAREAWDRLSKRFDYLSGLSHSIEPVTVGGTKFYRLRASAGPDASRLCGKLKVAGENCLIVN